MLPQDLSDKGYEIIQTDGTPEEFAEALIKSSLPRVFFDQLDLSTEVGQGQLLMMLISRRGQASLEKDEVVRFVERNRSEMGEFFETWLPAFQRAAAKSGEESVSKFIEYFGAHARYAYLNTPEKINVKSDRLLWLIYALAHHIDGGQLTYTAALEYLQKPVHFDRISELSLGFMLTDYAESIGKPSETGPTYLMLIGEAGRIKGIVSAASAAFAIVGKSVEADPHGNILTFVNNLEPFLMRHGRFDADGGTAAARIRTRFASTLRPDDF